MPSFKQTNQLGWPNDVGILAIEVYFPSQYVCQSELEEFDGESKGKYTIGLGQSSMGFCSDREDIISLCLTALTKLMENTSVGYNDIGFLEVGTETIVDKSKSVKTVLMQLFEESGNNDVEGVDTTNACYGGTAALFNAINWIESSAWDGRKAVVIAGDIAVYPKGSVRPTGGAGAIAMLIGPNAPLVFERGLRASDMRHSYDFYKPDFTSEYPTLDGKLSVQCYFKALDNCYQLYLKKASTNKFGSPFAQSLEDIDLMAFHTPFCKLVQKSFARLVLNDFLNCSVQDLSQKYPGLESFRGKTLEETYSDKDVEKAFMKFSAQTFEEKTKPSLLLASQIGNMYTPSLYAGLSSILASFTAERLAGKRIGMFSYGSGQAGSMFSIRVSNDCSVNSPLSRLIVSASKLKDRLGERYKVSPHKYTEVMNLRESTHNKASRIPAIDPSAPLFPGTYYLESVDEKFRRDYKRIPLLSPERYSIPHTLLNKEAFASNYTNGHSVESFKVSSS